MVFLMVIEFFVKILFNAISLNPLKLTMVSLISIEKTGRKVIAIRYAVQNIKMYLFLKGV